jgi:hypothetical protein
VALPCREGRPDGYLARQQEGELKYMLAFASPARALEWALLLQVGRNMSANHSVTSCLMPGVRSACWPIVPRHS